MKKLENLKADKFSKKSLNDVNGGRPPYQEQEPIYLPTRSVGTYVDGFNYGTDGYMD